MRTCIPVPVHLSVTLHQITMRTKMIKVFCAACQAQLCVYRKGNPKGGLIKLMHHHIMKLSHLKCATSVQCGRCESSFARAGQINGRPVSFLIGGKVFWK